MDRALFRAGFFCFCTYNVRINDQFMKIVRIDDENVVELAKAILQEGWVVMHPTETCYGFAVDIFNEQALTKLFKLKGRDFNKPVSILVDGFGMAQDFGLFSEKAQQLAAQYWPGPLSIVVPRKKSLPEFLNPGEDFISIRYSSDSFSEAMVSALGKPVTTTSANVTGEQPLYLPDVSVFGENAEEIELVVDGGEISMNKPSTVVKVDGDLVEVLRQGDVLCE